MSFKLETLLAIVIRRTKGLSELSLKFEQFKSSFELSFFFEQWAEHGV